VARAAPTTHSSFISPRAGLFYGAARPQDSSTRPRVRERRKITNRAAVRQPAAAAAAAAAAATAA